jgi:hypothetical protein
MAGMKANGEHRYPDAARAYHQYLKALEDVKGVGEGGLIPANFDLKAEIGEVLLLVGVYWDLAKIYDRTRSADKYREFKNNLDKFILFSRGLPHERMAKELLRKYLRRGRASHSKDFRDAYRLVSKDRCFVAGALVDVIDKETLPRLRAFRDERLVMSLAGRAFVACYYAAGPAVAAVVSRAPDAARARLARGIDWLASRLSE